MTKLIHKDLTYQVRGALFDVHNELGPMLPEAFIRDAIAIRMEEKGIACETEKPFTVYYHGVDVGRYFVDIWVENGELLLELKVVPQILPLHQAQAIAYLKVTNADLAFVANFGGIAVEIERFPNFVRGKQVDLEWKRRLTSLDLPCPPLANEVLSALFHVHVELGPGFLHQVYRRASRVAFREMGIGHTYIKQTPVYYHGHHLGNQDTRLLNVEEQILVATIAVRAVTDEMKMHLHMKMRHHDVPLGLIANFNRTTLEFCWIRGGNKG
ncbi:MAG: GxxExxY protein [Chloroflexi bacterium]|nr:MAG: GxxExxY protein [Chloroflexota bacterium]